MRLNVLRFIVVALACACAVVVISNLRAQKAAANEDEFAALYASLGMPVPVQTPAAPPLVQARTAPPVQTLE